MSRWSEEETVTIQKEAVSPNIFVNWNPFTDEAELEFHVRLMVYENGVVTDKLEMDPSLLNQMSILRVNFADITERVFTVDTPNGPVDVMGGLLGLAVKKIFDTLYVEYRDALATPPAEPEPELEP